MRSTGATLLGTLHLVLGALGILASAGLLLGAVLVAVAASHPAILPPVFAASSPTMSTAVWIFLLGLARASLSVVLVLAGIRVLDRSPAGYPLTKGAILGWTLLNVAEFFALREPFLWFCFMTLYPVAVDALLIRASFRRALSPEA